MRPYSKDLRSRVLAAVDRGTSREEAARTFSVSVPTIERWLKRRRETGRVDAMPIPGRPRVKGAALEGWLPGHLRENPDPTLEEHREAFEEQSGIAVSASTVGREIARLPGGWPLKKVPDSPRARGGAAGPVAVAGFPLRREEAGVRGRVGVPHLHGPPARPGSEGGAGLREGAEEAGPQPDAHRLHHPGGRRGRVGLDRGCHRLGALRDLRRALPRADALFGSGGRARRSRGAQDAQVRELVEARGADLLFLPPYSPDLNPIEEVFSKVKGIVRKAGARTRGALDVAVGEALSAVTPQDAAGWFAHCGYQPPDQPL